MADVMEDVSEDGGRCSYTQNCMNIRIFANKDYDQTFQIQLVQRVRRRQINERC